MGLTILQLLCSFLERLDQIQLLPGEIQVVPAEVAVGGGLGVDGALQIEVANDGRGAQVKVANIVFLQNFLPLL